MVAFILIIDETHFVLLSTKAVGGNDTFAVIFLFAFENPL